MKTMIDALLEKPILNSPCACLNRRWQLENGQSINVIVEAVPHCHYQ
jgi:hypothetical protein